MIWYLLLILFLLLILWLLLAPVIIIIHTETRRYTLYMPGLFRAEAVTGNGLFLIRGRILFVPYRFNPFARRKKKSRKKEVPRERRKKFKWPRGGLSLARDAFRTIHVKKLELDIDTDDFLLNAWLVPFFSMVQGNQATMRVNFEGYNALQLDVRVRMGGLLWAVIRNRIKAYV